jgi:AcrR family transcriptional regulator
MFMATRKVKNTAATRSRRRPAPASRTGSGRPRATAGGAGTDGLPREHVTEIQRVRVLSAMAEVASERGAGQTSVAHIVARAGVSRRTFYDLFEDREDCFLAAFEEALAQAAATVIPAFRGQARWRDAIREGLLALLMFCEANPALAQLCVAESLAAGPRALARREEIVDLLVNVVDQGRSERAARAPEPPPLAAEGAVGGVLSVIHRRLLSERPPQPLTPLLGELMSTLVLPYLGSGGAQRERNKPNPPLPPPKPRPHGDPLEGLDMRITYRTVRVLIAIGQTPGASNRDIADAAGIADQGQVSKLLTRLDSLGLIHNEGAGHAKGGSNAWALTPRGREVEGAIRVQTASGEAQLPSS